MVDIEKVDKNPWQPRATLTDIEQLVANIEAVGLLQRPLVRKVGKDKYQLAFGHRRAEAVRRLVREGKWKGGLPVEVRELTDTEMAVIALSENTRRKDLRPLEEYRAWKKAINDTDLTVTKLAEQLQLNESTVSNNLRILALPASVLKLVDDGDLSAHAAREFLCLMNDDHKHEDDMLAIIKDIKSSSGGHRGLPDFSVRHVRERICSRAQRHDVIIDGVGWRPIESYSSNTFNPNGSRARSLTFDGQAFAKEFPSHVHNIPAERGEKSVMFTCMGKEWQKRQTDGTRERNKALEAKDGAGAKAPASQRGNDFTKVLAKHPLGKAAGIKAGTTPNKDQVEALGALATAASTNGRMDEFAKPIRQDALRYDSLPDYFPDIKECLERCTIGAKLRQQYQGSDQWMMVCTNEAHFNEKLEAGLQKAREGVECQRQTVDAQDLRLADLLTPYISPLAGTAIILNMLDGGGVAFHAVRPFDRSAESQYEAATVKELRLMVGEKEAKLDRYNTTVLSLDKKDLPKLGDRVPRAAALMLVEEARDNNRIGELMTLVSGRAGGAQAQAWAEASRGDGGQPRRRGPGRHHRAR